MFYLFFQFMSEKIGNDAEKTRMEDEFVEMERVCYVVYFSFT